MADVGSDTDGLQSGKPAGILGVAAADRYSAFHEDARDARHAGSTDADDVNGAEFADRNGHAVAPCLAAMSSTKPAS